MSTNEKEIITEEMRTKVGQVTGMVGILCNLVLAAAKLAIGMISGAVSIVADAVNNFADAGSSIISIVGFKLASKPADEKHPFGYARYEYLSGLVVSCLVLFAGFELLKSSVDKVLHPEPVEFSIALVLVLVLSIAGKLWLSAYNRKMGKKIDSSVLIATADDSRNDCISTGAVLIAALIAHFTGFDLDGYVGVLVALFILYSGVGLVRETIAPILGETPDPELVKHIEERVMRHEEVMGIHDLIVHDYGPGRQFASVHVELPAETDVLVGHELIDLIEYEFRTEDKLMVTVHYDPIVTSDSAVGELRTYMDSQAKEIHESLSIHDLRIVPGENNTNVIFDCVVPHQCPVKEEDVVSQLRARLKKQYPNHTAVIQIDHSYI